MVSCDQRAYFAGSQTPLTSILCSELRLRSSWPLADSVPPKGRGKAAGPLYEDASAVALRAMAEPTPRGRYEGQASLLCVGRGERNVPFYQTNPPFSEDFIDATAHAQVTCDGNERTISVGSFWKTNPPEGVFMGVT
jgi:hypothetical protein